VEKYVSRSPCKASEVSLVWLALSTSFFHRSSLQVFPQRQAAAGSSTLVRSHSITLSSSNLTIENLYHQAVRASSVRNSSFPQSILRHTVDLPILSQGYLFVSSIN